MFRLRKKSDVVGVLLAPGRKQDYALNLFVFESLSNRQGIVFEKFQDSRAPAIEVEKRLHRLVSRGCKIIIVVGHQCKSATIKFIKNSDIRPDLRFFLVDDPSTPRDDPENLHVLFKKDSGPKLFALNLLEYTAGTHLSRILGSILGQDKRRKSLAFIAGADVPVIQEFYDGLLNGHDWKGSDIEFHGTTLGSSYSRFSDEWSGYRVTKYLIERYRITHLVQACGYACRGVFRAIADAETTIRPRLYNFDYSNWQGTFVENLDVDLSFVRKIDNKVDKIMSSEGEIDNIKFDDICVGDFVSHRPEITDIVADFGKQNGMIDSYFGCSESLLK